MFHSPGICTPFFSVFTLHYKIGTLKRFERCENSCFFFLQLQSWFQTSNGDLIYTPLTCAPKGADFQAMMSQVFVTGPKLGVHIQLVKLENSFSQIQRKWSRRCFFLDQLADTWTDQVHRLAIWTEPEDHCQPSKQQNKGIFHDLISKKTLRRMKNQEDLAKELLTYPRHPLRSLHFMKPILSSDFLSIIII